jgi:phosphoribosylglycinamide formyltransferase-1
MIRLAILGSTRGTVLPDIIAAIEQKKLPAKIVLVMSNKADALILEKAQKAEIMAHFIDPAHLTREQYDEKVLEVLKNQQIEYIVLIGYMRILSKEFVDAFPNKIINVHPSLLPDFSGLMDLSVHEAVLREKKTETGCTVHYVTEVVDAGPILLQKKCPVYATDTAEQLKSRVQALESSALIAAITLLCEENHD